MKIEDENLKLIELLKWLCLANLLELYSSMGFDNYNRFFFAEKKRKVKWMKKDNLAE